MTVPLYNVSAGLHCVNSFMLTWLLTSDRDRATKSQRLHGWLEPTDARRWLYCCELGEHICRRDPRVQLTMIRSAMGALS